MCFRKIIEGMASEHAEHAWTAALMPFFEIDGSSLHLESADMDL